MPFKIYTTCNDCGGEKPATKSRRCAPCRNKHNLRKIHAWNIRKPCNCCGVENRGPGSTFCQACRRNKAEEKRASRGLCSECKTERVANDAGTCVDCVADRAATSNMKSERMKAVLHDMRTGPECPNKCGFRGQHECLELSTRSGRDAAGMDWCAL